MPAKKYDFLIFIGRFQPFHLGHLALVEEGLQQAERIIVLCGSARQARSFRSPWNPEERERMIRGALSPEDNNRVHIVGVADHRYNENAWLREVQGKVNQVVSQCGRSSGESLNLALASQAGEEPGNYSTYFPTWKQVKLDVVTNVSGSAIRQAMLEATDANKASVAVSQALPPNVAEDVVTFLDKPIWHAIVEERQYIAQYQRTWSVAPYAPTFVTVDALVVQSGHILVVERKGPPGKGLLALPGGFVDPEETLLNACLRELKEETCLDVCASTPGGTVKNPQVFDDPHRSARGRTITHVFFIELPAGPSLPKVRGSDDARRAFWLPLAELESECFFEDHYCIIECMLGLA